MRIECFLCRDTRKSSGAWAKEVRVSPMSLICSFASAASACSSCRQIFPRCSPISSAPRASACKSNGIHSSIIFDIFPRSQKTGYFGDLSRTVVRGRASEKLKEIYATVQAGQQIGFDMIREGADGKEVHQKILALFDARGFPTGRIHGRMQGFFHGTGHGLGLDIHEPPRIAPVEAILRKGHVVTVEPGLYYLGVGGVRLEDVVVVNAKGNRNLTDCPQFLEI